MINLNSDNFCNSELLKPWQTPEIKLLLCCARTQIDAELADLIEELSYCQLDWDYVLKFASKNRLNCLLYQNLNDICPEAIPTQILNKLRLDFINYSLTNQFFTQELVKLLKIFTQHQIPAIPYKGPALALELYQSLSLRYFNDLDILINPLDLVKVKSLLVAEGYKTSEVDNRQEVDNIESDNEREFIGKDGKVFVDLHWRITPRFFPFELEFEQLWEECQRLAILDYSAPNLSPEDLLLILCVHGAKECWYKLIWISDIAQLINTYPQLNWDKIVKQAQSLSKQRILFLGLFLAKELRGIHIPIEIASQIEKDKNIKLLAQEVCQQLFRGDAFINAWQTTWFRWRTQERYQDKIAYIYWRVIAPNYRDRKTLVLPRSLSFVYYFVRPIRLIKEKIQ